MSTQPILHVDMTPDADLPARILRAYLNNCDVPFKPVLWSTEETQMRENQRKRAEVLAQAIARLERGAKVAEGMHSARANGRPLGRPVKLAKLEPKIRKLHRGGATGAEIVRALAGKASAPWIYGVLRKISSKTKK